MRARGITLFGQNVIVKRASLRRRLLAAKALAQGEYIQAFSHLVGADLSDVEASEFFTALPVLIEVNLGTKHNR